MSDHDYLVLYEETVDEASTRDDVTIDVDLHTHKLGHRVEAEFGAAVSNASSAWAVTGLILVILGALLAVISAVLFAIYYPAEWWPEPTETIPRIVFSLVLIAIFFMIIGNLMVGFGRRLRARGTLHKVRFLPADD